MSETGVDWFLGGVVETGRSPGSDSETGLSLRSVVGVD